MFVIIAAKFWGNFSHRNKYLIFFVVVFLTWKLECCYDKTQTCGEWLWNEPWALRRV